MKRSVWHRVEGCQVRLSWRCLQITWWMLLLFFLINLAYTGFVGISHDKASEDALVYYASAVNLLEGEGFSRDFQVDPDTTTETPPFEGRGRFLFPFFLSFVFRLFGASISASNLVAAFFKSCLVIPLILIGKNLFNDDYAGLIAGLIYTLNPAYVSLGSLTMPETTTAFFYYLGILFFLKYYQSLWPLFIVLAGLTVSLSYLARPEGLFLLILGVGTILVRNRSRRWRDLLLLFSFPLLALTLGSWLIFGRVASVSPYQTSLALLPDWADFYNLKEFTLTTYLNRVGGPSGALGVRLYNCLLFLRNMFSDGLWLDRSIGLLPGTFIIPIGLSLVRPLSRRDKTYVYLLTLFMVAQFVFTIGYPGYPRMSTEFRHGQIIGPFVIILAAAGLTFLCRRCWQIEVRPVIGSLCRAAGGLLVVHYAVFSLIFLSLGLNDALWTPTVRGPLVEGSEWIRDNLPEDVVIMSRKPAVVNYFSQRPVIVFPTASYADIMAYAQTYRVTHFLMTDLERSGLPNLEEGLRIYANHFRNVYTTDTFAVVAVQSYDYGNERPVVDDDWYVGPENVKRHLYDWRTLWSFEGSHALEEVWDVWSQWRLRIQKNILTLAKDQKNPNPIEHRIDMRLGNDIRLLGYDLSVERVQPGGSIQLTLYWQCLQAMKTDYTVFTHALDESGALRAGQDSPPIYGLHPTSRWAADETVRDRYDLTFGLDSPTGQYMIEVGMYDGLTGQRLPVYIETGEELPDRRVLLGSVKVK